MTNDESKRLAGWVLRRVLACFALIAAVIVACGNEMLPPPITDDEIAALGIQQGIAGRTAVRDGSCMPGCAAGGCAIEPIALTLRVLQPDPALVLPTDFAQMCDLHTPTVRRLKGFALTAETSPVVVAEVDLSTKEEFALSLEPGTYQVVLVDDSGCAYCPSSEEQGTVATCGRVTVVSGQVAHYDILMNLAVE